MINQREIQQMSEANVRNFFLVNDGIHFCQGRCLRQEPFILGRQRILTGKQSSVRTFYIPKAYSFKSTTI